MSSCAGHMQEAMAKKELEKTQEKPTALVTGGAGFVGTNLCLELKRRGYQVKCLDNNRLDRLWELQKLGIEKYHSDVLEPLEIFKAAKECDVIFHLAVVCLPHTFKEPHYSLEVATMGTLNAFSVARKVGAFFVYASSSEIYGDGSVPMAEAQCPRATTLYGVGKAAGELVTEAYAKMHSLRDRYLIIRPFNCYGPYSREDKYATVITNFLKALISSKEATIHGHGKQTRDFMHVSDTVDGIITAYEQRERLALNPVVNICTGRETSLNDLWDLCTEAVISEGVVLPEPGGPFLTYDPARIGDIKRMWGMPWYAHETIGWKSKIGLLEGLKDYTRWMLKNHE